MDAPAAEPKIESSEEPSEDIPRKVPMKSVETGKSVFTAVSREAIFLRPFPPFCISCFALHSSFTELRSRSLLRSCIFVIFCLQLLNTCKKAESSSEMDVIVNKMWKRFHQADSSYTSSANFIDSVKKLIPGATKEPYSQLKVVSDDLKFHTVGIFFQIEINY